MADSEQPTDELPGDGSATGLADPPLIAAGRSLGGRYRLKHRIGHGGMAVVWLATDERLGREVAVKVLSDTFTADRDYLGRFAREARVAAGLQHPNLVSVYDYDAGARPYLVMEYVEGGDLAQRLDRGETPPPAEIAEELLSALRHIHAAGVLHRDIKPQNVLIDARGHARLTDFGIAMPADGTSLTGTGEVIGTKSYLAPEVVAGSPASERSDLYALGVVLGVVLADTARADADAGLWALVDRLRSPEPEGRPASAAAALVELDDGRTPPPGEPTRPYRIELEPTATAATRPPFEPTPTGVHSTGRGGRVLALAAIAVAAIVAVVLAVSGGNDGGEGGGAADRSGENGAAAGTAASGSGSGGSGGGEGSNAGGAPGASTEQAAAEPAAEPPAATPPSDDGATLNDQGFELVGAGRYEEAVPVLERAVEALGDSGDETTYNYALYNLASAYLGAGRPADAIPLLQERLGFDDGQLAEVEAALDRAYAEAGVEPPAETTDDKPGNGPKPGKGPKKDKTD